MSFVVPKIKVKGGDCKFFFIIFENLGTPFKKEKSYELARSLKISDLQSSQRFNYV